MDLAVHKAPVLLLAAALAGCTLTDPAVTRLPLGQGDLVVRLTLDTEPTLDAWWAEEAPAPPTQVDSALTLIVYKGDAVVGTGPVSRVDDRTVGVWWSSLTGTPVSPGDRFVFELRNTTSDDRLAFLALEVVH